MKFKVLHFKKTMSIALLILLTVAGMTKVMAQTPYRQYANDGVLLNFHEIDNVDFRLFLLYNLSQDDQFVLIEDDTPGLFSIIAENEENNTSFYDAFESFYQNAYADFSLLSKSDLLSLIPNWKSNIPPTYLVSIMMDISLRNSRNDNYLCANSLPFYTTEVVQYEAATTSQTADQLEGNYFDDGCIGSSYNPSWFNMEIGNPGQFIIHLEGHDPNNGTDRDIDFCIWGPFTDPITPCVAQLTTNKIMDCSYSASYSENLYLGYPEGEHSHTTSHGTVNYHMPESGEYYILMLTNYSRQPCLITFTKIEGSGPGTSGCNGQKSVTANVNPTGRGRIVGAGVYDCGSTCTLTAIANPGYMFMDWTDENGNVVSTDAEYSFTVWSNRTFTANFVEDNACYLTFDLYDTNGDGWSGNYLVLNFEDGYSQKLTVPYGLSASSYSLPIADGSHISLGWISGANTDQCSFLVSYSNGNGIYNGTDLNENLNYEFDVDCVGMPAMFYTISATANPSTGGMISFNWNAEEFFNNFVTDSGAMNNGADASWTKGSQSTFGPGCQQANGNRVGDSFTLTAATTINEIEVYGYQTGSSTTSTFNGLYAQIYDGNPMAGGQVVWGDANANIMTATVFTNCYRGSDGDATGTTRPIMSVTASNLNIELAAGTYYLVYQLSGTGSSGPWGQPHAEPGIGNTGSGVQWLGSDGAWQNLTDTGAGTPYGCAMKITGITGFQYGTSCSFSQGETCTLRAFPNYGYAFENWKENGNVISTNAEFSFIVNSNRDLVANFTKVPLTITAIPNYENRGTVSGSGEYYIDDTCTLTATANAGFAFANWTKDGAIVSTDAEYTFIVVSEADFVANFVTEGNIVFADANVKSICVSHWDTNGDGELSYVEAAAVTDLGNYFQGNTEILMFNELQYFIGLSSIGANAFNNCTGLTLITLPSTLTSIGNYAFYNCSGLIGGLTIPNAVTTIGDYAFYNCSGFMGLLTIGNSVTSIGNYAFYGCRNFTGSINIPNSVVTIGNYAFQGCTAFWGTLTIGNSVTSIGSYAFSGCTGLVGDIVIPNSVTSIGSNAFYDCHSFGGTLTIGNSITTIGSSAFYSCYGLTGSLVIPNSVTTIGNSAFYNCYGFTGTLTIGNSVTTIGSSAFRSCSNLVGNIEIPRSVTNIGSEAFYYCYSFDGNLIIPSSVTTIGSRAFYYCPGLSQVYYNVTNHADISEGYYNYPFESCGGHLNIGNNVVRIPANMFRNANFTGILTIPSSVVAINDNAFNNCWHLTGTLVIPNSINTIGISAFQDCDGLSEIIMGNNVMIVGNTAFYSCSGLTKVTLPEPVTVIGIEAFRYCTQLSEVNMQSMQAPSIGWDVFSDNATGRIINIPCGATGNYSDGYWEEWASALNEMCDDYEITVVVNPAVAGSVTGAGNYYYSQMCTLIATGNLGYPFINWTKNGVVVSTEATYIFGVTESSTYVANFSPTPVSYDITVSANFVDGGTVTGAGNYLHGATVTLTATANEGYTFVNWTKNGIVVSTNPTYDFIITEAGSYIANFELNTYEITATANPSEGGTVTGAGVYGHETTCTLTATANEGYTFANWTENDVEVSTDGTYSFTVTDNHNLVANFLRDLHWSVDIYQYPYNMSVTGIIQIYGEEQSETSLEIGAFCGDVCRGTQRLTYFPQVDRYLVYLTLYGNSGDVMSFRLYDNALGEELDLACASTISFVPDGIIGTPFDPYVFDFDNSIVDQVSNFSEGYNWWSTYIEQEGIDGLGMLQNGLVDNGVSIRSQASGYTDYYENYGWYGSLSSINNESSYRVITSQPCTVVMAGGVALPSEHPITLSQGWTWIGYVPSTVMSVDAAMAGVDATSGDKLKSQQGYSDYYVGYGWFGSLNRIEPGMGLMYYSTNSSPITFTYPDSNRRGEVRANLTPENNHWIPNTYAYPDNMTVMAVVELDDKELTSDRYELAAFTANGECRGSVKLMYAEPLHRHVAFLTISGKDAAELSFRLYDTETGMEYYDAEESFDFVANAIVGEADNLYTIHFRGTMGVDEFAGRVKIYPNPVNRGEQFSIGMAGDVTELVRIEIINTLGMVETVTPSRQTLTAPNVAGVYTLRITVEGKGTIVRKLVVK